MDEKKQKDALEKSEEKFRIVAESAYEWEYWRRPDGIFEYSSPSCKRITGYVPEDFMHDKELLERIISPEDRPAWLSFCEECLKRQLPGAFEFRMIRLDGEIRWIFHVCQSVFDTAGNHLGIRASNRDITGRKREEEALAIANKELIFQSAEKEKRIAELTVAHEEIVKLNKVFSAKAGMGWIAPLWVALAIVIVVGGVWFFKTQVADSEKGALETLTSIAKLKIKVIEDWRSESVADARVLAGSRYLIPAIHAWMSNPTAEDTDDIINRFRLSQENYKYSNVLLIDRAGKILMNTRSPGTRESLPREVLSAMESAIRDHKPVMTDLYPDPVTGKPRFDVVAPFFEHTAGKGKFVAAVVLTEDPEIFLYPMIKEWPIPSETAETLIVRRDGDSVLWLNDTRFSSEVAFKKREPLSKVHIPAVQAALGKRGLFYGTDYRGKKVVSFLASVPDSPWLMVSKIETSEIFAGIQNKLFLFYGIVAALLAGALILTLAMRQRVMLYKGLHEKDQIIRSTALRLEEANKELEAFSYSVAHDLRAPLRAISGFANILSEDYAPKLDDNATKVIAVINDNVKNMGQLIEDLLKLAHMGRLPVNFAALDVTALAQSVSHELKGALSPDRAIEVSVKPMPSARADAVLVRQIFTNLISNAMKFTSRKEKAVIEIGDCDKDGEHAYYVKDNGAGFDMKYKDKLFGIFQRLHSQDEFGGTGIGLAIVRSAVQRNGGRAWAEGEVGQGATFFFTLPKGG